MGGYGRRGQSDGGAEASPALPAHRSGSSVAGGGGGAAAAQRRSGRHSPGREPAQAEAEAGRRGASGALMGGGPSVNPERAEELLARRYRWLVRAYPADYRDRRGEEIVGLLLDASAPGQRWPAPAAAADLLVGGLRRRIGGLTFASVSGCLSAAGPMALALAAGLSLFWLLGYELAGEPNWTQYGVSPLGPFETSAPITYAAWVATAASYAYSGGTAGR
jgi:hypothetical protein